MRVWFFCLGRSCPVFLTLFEAGRRGHVRRPRGCGKTRWLRNLTSAAFLIYASGHQARRTSRRTRFKRFQGSLGKWLAARNCGKNSGLGAGEFAGTGGMRIMLSDSVLSPPVAFFKDLCPRKKETTPRFMASDFVLDAKISNLSGFMLDRNQTRTQRLP